MLQSTHYEYLFQRMTLYNQSKQECFACYQPMFEVNLKLRLAKPVSRLVKPDGCSHAMHATCMLKWIAFHSSKRNLELGSCCYCRTKFFTLYDISEPGRSVEFNFGMFSFVFS